MSRNIAEILDEARARLHRLDPHETVAAQVDGAAVIDIRPIEQRSRHGEIPGAIVVDRNVLEWRLDPKSDARLPLADDAYDRQIIVVCQQGYASSLAAATLQEIGLHRATDLAGGFEAWQAAGLPIDKPE